MHFEQVATKHSVQHNEGMEKLEEEQYEKLLDRSGERVARLIAKAGNRITPDILTAIDGRQYDGKVMKREGLSAFDALEQNVGEFNTSAQRKKGIIETIEKDDRVDIAADEVLWQALQIIGRDNGGVFPEDLFDVYIEKVTKRIAQRVRDGQEIGSAVKAECDLLQTMGIGIDGDMGVNVRNMSVEELLALEARDIASRLIETGGDIDNIVDDVSAKLGERKVWINTHDLKKKVQKLREEIEETREAMVA